MEREGLRGQTRGGRITALPGRIGAAVARGDRWRGGAWAGAPGVERPGMMKVAGAERAGNSPGSSGTEGAEENSQGRQASQCTGTLRERRPGTHSGGEARLRSDGRGSSGRDAGQVAARG